MKQNTGARRSFGSDLRHNVHAAGLIFKKDLQVEFRTRYALGSVSLFSLTTVVAVSGALSSQSLHSDVKAALLWVVLLFAAMSGLARVFVREVEAGTSDGLKLYAPAASVYAGKLLFNLALVAAVEVITVPLYLIVLPPQVIHPGLLISVLALGGLGLSSAATFIASLIAQAKSGKSALFFTVAFPVLMPLLLVAVKSTVGAFDLVPAHQSEALSGMVVLACYSVVTTTAALLLFEYVWRD